jgi:hypothetical protein
MILLALLACRPVDDASRTLDEALHAVHVGFGEAPDAELAPLVRNLERRMYQSLRIDDGDAVARSVSPTNLTREEVAIVEPRPRNADPANTLAVLTAYPSPFEVSELAAVPIYPDQTEVEPASPDHYDRTFTEGADCWRDVGCPWLRTVNELTKVYVLNLLPPLTYGLQKDYRWVDLAADLGTGEPRWGIVVRSWNPESVTTEDGRNQVVQSYTVEVFLPRDGRGFVWEDDDPERPATQGDSSVGGTLRMMTVWSEAITWISADPASQEPVVRGGINDIFVHQDAWLRNRLTP